MTRRCATCTRCGLLVTGASSSDEAGAEAVARLLSNLAVHRRHRRCAMRARSFNDHVRRVMAADAPRMAEYLTRREENLAWW